MKALGFFLAVLLSVVPAQAQPVAPDMRLWSEQVVSDIMAYDAGNFDSKLENNRHLFTKTGYIKYMRALNQAKIPDLIKKAGYEARVKILCGAQFLPPLAADKEGVIRVRVPIEQIYATKAQMLTRKNMIIDLVLHPDSSSDVPARMAIDQARLMVLNAAWKLDVGGTRRSANAGSDRRVRCRRRTAELPEGGHGRASRMRFEAEAVRDAKCRCAACAACDRACCG